MLNDLDIAVLSCEDAAAYISSHDWTPAFARHVRHIVVLRPDSPINYLSGPMAANRTLISPCYCVKPTPCEWCGRLSC